MGGVAWTGGRALKHCVWVVQLWVIFSFLFLVFVFSKFSTVSQNRSKHVVLKTNGVSVSLRPRRGSWEEGASGAGGWDPARGGGNAGSLQEASRDAPCSGPLSVPHVSLALPPSGSLPWRWSLPAVAVVQALSCRGLLTAPHSAGVPEQCWTPSDSDTWQATQTADRDPLPWGRHSNFRRLHRCQKSPPSVPTLTTEARCLDST